MLKIKDNVDLKELEKFRFKEIDEFGVIDYVYSKKSYDLIVSNAKELYIQDDFAVSREIPDEILNILYDLIKADLVEKIEE